MNTKIIVALVVIALLVGTWFYNNKGSESVTALRTEAASVDNPAPVDAGAAGIDTSFKPAIGDAHIARTDERFIDGKIVPASQKYRSAEEALEAIKKGAGDYDDFVLEEFVELGDCAWCDKLYTELATMVKDPNISMDERSYYGELLAISGDLDNIKTLVNGVEQASSEDERDMFAESLELAVGDDQMVSFLSKNLNSENETLRESSVAAISNQGSRFAAETLYQDKLTGAGKDQDYYDLGIGLGEMVPDEEALPFLQEIVINRSPHADLAVKALINSGLQGLTIVFDSLASETDPARGRELLTDAVDHVITEDGVEKFLEDASKNPSYPEFLKEFANDALMETKAEELDELE